MARTVRGAAGYRGGHARDYGELRYVALGRLEGVVVSLVYAERNDQVRLISIRKALKHETRFFLSQIGK